MQIRHLRFLLALDRERHFARAAQACNVSQPALSAGIAALEQQVGHRLIERDRRFIGFTAHGRLILPWAQQAVAAIDGLAQAIEGESGPLKGELRLGAIPASMPFAGAFAAALRQQHPQLNLTVASLTSREISARLADFSLDVGLTYLEHEPPANVVSVPLYRERMMFVQACDEGEARETIPWTEIVARPLGLLNQRMQNRRILDANLAAAGRALAPCATADSYVALLALVQTGAFATLMPDSYRPLLPEWAQMTAPEEPLPDSLVGLIVPDRNPLTPLAMAALQIARRLSRAV